MTTGRKQPTPAPGTPKPEPPPAPPSAQAREAQARIADRLGKPEEAVVERALEGTGAAAAPALEPNAQRPVPADQDWTPDERWEAAAPDAGTAPAAEVDATPYPAGPVSRKMYAAMRAEVVARRREGADHPFPCLCDDCLRAGFTRQPSPPLELEAALEAAGEWHARGKAASPHAESVRHAEVLFARIGQLEEGNMALEERIARGDVHERRRVERMDALLSRVVELEATQYVPGTFACDGCHFVEHRSEMSAASGDVRPRAGEDPPRCPNASCPRHGQTMRPVTWWERAQDLQEALLEQERHPIHVSIVEPKPALAPEVLRTEAPADTLGELTSARARSSQSHALAPTTAICALCERPLEKGNPGPLCADCALPLSDEDVGAIFDRVNDALAADRAPTGFGPWRAQTRASAARRLFLTFAREVEVAVRPDRHADRWDGRISTSRPEPTILTAMDGADWKWRRNDDVLTVGAISAPRSEWLAAIRRLGSLE